MVEEIDFKLIAFSVCQKGSEMVIAGRRMLQEHELLQVWRYKLEYLWWQTLTKFGWKRGYMCSKETVFRNE